VIEGSYKRRDEFREKLIEVVKEALSVGELQNGWDLNQELGLRRLGHTHWGSHYKTLTNMIIMFAPNTGVLDHIVIHGNHSSHNVLAQSALHALHHLSFLSCYI